MPRPVPPKVFGVHIVLVTGVGIGFSLYILLGYFPDIPLRALQFAGAIAPIWAPAFATLIFWRIWVRYRHASYNSEQKTAVLEVRLPREIRKTPLAMEAFFSSLYFSFGETTFVDRNFLGKTRTWISFELVSIEGNIHYYIWTRDFFKDLIKAQLYAHYPEVEVLEVEDYTAHIPFDLDKYMFYGCDFVLTRPDPYPIKTYVEYGLDEAGAEEEEKTDPFLSMLEVLGAVPKGHQLWMQMIIQTHKPPKKWPWQDKSTNDIQNQAKKEIEKIVVEAAHRTKMAVGQVSGGDEEAGYSGLNLTDGEKETIKTIEHGANKVNYDAGIRGMIIGEKGNFNATYLVGMLAMFRPFNAPHHNSLTYTRFLAGYDYPWQDYKDIMRNRDRRRVYEAFRMRSWFHGPYEQITYVLNVEELATLWHFPGEVAQTPTIPRIESRRGEAPANLPV